MKREDAELNAPGPDEREDDHEELEQGHRDDDQVDGGGMDAFADLARRVHVRKVVPDELLSVHI